MAAKNTVALAKINANDSGASSGSTHPDIGNTDAGTKLSENTDTAALIESE